MARCPSCSSEVPEASRFCLSCGAAIASDASAPTVTVEPVARPRPSSSAAGHGRFLPGTVLAKRYRIVSLLGRGGMGEVCRADDLKLGQAVALKFLPKAVQKDASRLDRFHNEVRVARQVSHPNVCRVYDIGEADGQPFISMEYVDGEDLASLLRRIGRLPQDKAVQIARQICAGLAAAHDRGVLHRDMKPANVMIDGRGQARITDFGLAGLVDEFADDDLRAGTPAYMAPEQRAGKEVTIRSDIYSLGLVLFELFTGRGPDDARAFAERSGTRTQTTPTLATTAGEALDPTIERVLMRCLQVAPERRPQSALLVGAALPGGDPLAAALAAGETPSPELVAAAGETGSLSMRAGLLLLGAYLVVLGLYAGLSTHLRSESETAPAKAPVALADDAIDVVRGLGYVDPPVDSAYGLGPGGRWFWYRQSPSPLLPHAGNGVVTPADPPRDRPGMVSVFLESDGRLRAFVALGQPGENAPTPPLTEVEAKALFEKTIQAAGIDPAALQPAESLRTLLGTYDQRFAWTAGDAIRIDAAVLAGRPANLSIRRTSGEQAAPEESAVPDWLRASSAGSDRVRAVIRPALPVVFIGIMIGCVVFARRNLRLGRGDRRGAIRLGVVVVVAGFLSRVLVAEHWGSSLALVGVVTRLLGDALFGGVFVLTLYLAVEPYVRRAWPERIVSTTRLLAGRLTDPLIGRDLLIGLLIGITAKLLFLAIGFASVRYGFSTGRYHGTEALDATLTMRHTVSALLAGIADGTGAALQILFLFVFLLAVFRRRAIAIPSLVVALFVIICSIPQGGGVLGMVLIGAVWTAYNSVAMLRFGPLALSATSLVVFIGDRIPPTLDFSAWDAANVWFAHAVLLGLAVYGFAIATRGQTLLTDEAFDSATQTKA